MMTRRSRKAHQARDEQKACEPTDSARKPLLHNEKKTPTPPQARASVQADPFVSPSSSTFTSPESQSLLSTQLVQGRVHQDRSSEGTARKLTMLPPAINDAALAFSHLQGAQFQAMTNKERRKLKTCLKDPRIAIDTLFTNLGMVAGEAALYLVVMSPVRRRTHRSKGKANAQQKQERRSRKLALPPGSLNGPPANQGRGKSKK